MQFEVDSKLEGDGGSMREGKDNGGCAGVVDRGGHSGDEHV